MCASVSPSLYLSYYVGVISDTWLDIFIYVDKTCGHRVLPCYHRVHGTYMQLKFPFHFIGEKSVLKGLNPINFNKCEPN